MSQTDGASTLFSPVPQTMTQPRVESKVFIGSTVRSGGNTDMVLPLNPRPAILTGILVLALIVLGIGGWSATAPLSSGVTAPGVVVFEGRRQRVQHLEGGIIEEILVREGVEVAAGDVLFRLDPTQVSSRATRIRNLKIINEAQSARLSAELIGADEVIFSAELIREAKALGWDGILERERSVFEERRRSLAGQIELLDAKVSQISLEIDGLDAQELAYEEQLVLVASEISDMRSLLETNLVPRARVTALEREAARLRGLAGEIVASRSRALESISESRLQAEQLRQQFREEIVSSLSKTENEIGDLREQLVSAVDILTRTDIVAPQSGRVQNLSVTTVGSVIQPGQSLLEIAPLADNLIIEARVAPQDIDSVSIGQSAEVRISALNLRMIPAVFGNVRSVSGDRIADQRAEAEYFLVQIDIVPGELEKLGNQRVVAGMPAEVILHTGERTLINYLISPLADAMRRGLLER